MDGKTLLSLVWLGSWLMGPSLTPPEMRFILPVSKTMRVARAVRLSFMLFAVAAGAVLCVGAAPPAGVPSAARPLIFAHRGASGERPEHTMGAYRLALEQGADFVEPDLRMTKDGVFIALHDVSLNRTTDVALHPEFESRAKRDLKGGKFWVPGDFTLAEIRTLRCIQGTAGRSKEFDGREPIPTLEEVVGLVRGWNRERGAHAGVVPELRGGAEAFIDFVHEQRLEEAGAPPIYLQSFEAGTLRKVREVLKFPAALLLAKQPDAATLGDARTYCTAVAVSKGACIAEDSAGWIKEAGALGLQVIAWTFEDARFDKARFASSQEEMECAFRNGVAAVFTDYPATGVKARLMVLRR